MFWGLKQDASSLCRGFWCRWPEWTRVGCGARRVESSWTPVADSDPSPGCNPVPAALRPCSSWVVLSREPHPLSRKPRSPGSGSPARNIRPPRRAHVSPDVHPRAIRSPGRAGARSTGGQGTCCDSNSPSPGQASLPSFSNLKIACHRPRPSPRSEWATGHPGRIGPRSSSPKYTVTKQHARHGGSCSVHER